MNFSFFSFLYDVTLHQIRRRDRHGLKAEVRKFSQPLHKRSSAYCLVCPTAWGMSTCQRLRVSSLFFGTSQTLYNTQFPRKVVIQYFVISYTLLPMLSEAIRKTMDATKEKVIFEYWTINSHWRWKLYQEDDSSTLSSPKQWHSFAKIPEILITSLWYKISEGHSNLHEQNSLGKASCIFLVMKKITSFIRQNFKPWDSQN